MSFSKKVEQFSMEALKKADTVRKAAVMELFSSIINDTPVENGYLRGAWIATIDAPDLAVRKTADKTGSATKSAMQIVVKRSTLTDTLYFSNALPYGPRIEYEGYSTQKAPNGMVRKNIGRLQGVVAAQIVQTR